MEEALRQSEGRSEAILSSLHETLIPVYDREGTITSLWGTPELDRRYGFNAADLAGRSLADIYPPDQAKERIARIQHVFDTGEPAHDEYLAHLPGGDFWLEVSLSPIRAPSGEVSEVIGFVRDITGRKRAEQALRESEARFSRLIDAAPEGIAIHDEGKILGANQGLAKMFGYQRGEIIGMHALELTAPESRNLVQRHIASGDETPYEAMGLRKDGSTFHGQLYGRSCPYNGRTVRLTAIRDITERKRAEKALRESEERFRHLFEAAFEGIAIHENGVILAANPALATITGYPVPELIGKPIFDLLTTESRDFLVDKIRSGAGKPDDWSWQVVLQKKDGSTVDVEILGKLCTYRGRAVRVTAVRDITERRRAEEALQQNEQRFRHLFEAVFEGIAIHENGVILEANPAFADISGYPLSELIGKSIFDLLTGESRDFLVEKIRCGAGEPNRWDAVGRKKDGSIYHAEIIGQAYTYQGRAVRVTAVRDITERKRAEEACRQAEQRYRDLFEQAPAMYAITRNQNGAPIVADCNGLFLSTLGYSRADALGRPLADFYSAKSRAELLEGGGYQRALEGRFIAEERQLVTRDGHIVETLLRALPERDADGHVVGTRAMYVDITERKRAEKALRESEERYRLLVENMWDVIWTMDLNLRYTYVSSPGPIRGYSAEEAMSQTMEEALTPGSAEVARKALAEELAIEEMEQKDLFRSRTLELEFNCKDGSTVWLEARMTALRDQDGNATGILGVSRDITERKRAEEALEESEERYRSLVEASPDAITLTDLNANAIMVNEQTVKLHGFDTAEEMIGRNALELIAPEDHERAAENTRRTLETGITRNVEYTLLRKDGSRFPAELSASLITDAEGNPKAFTAVTRDVTERKRAEQALRESEECYRELSDSITDVFFALDENLRYTYWNAASETLTGIAAKDAIGRSIHELFQTPQAARAAEVYREVLQTRQPRTFVTQYHIAGKDYFFDISAYPSKTGLSVFVKDITDRRQAQAALRESEERHRSLFEATFEGVVIHEDGLILDANPAFEKMVGRPLSELVGTSVVHLLGGASRDLILQKMRSSRVEHYEAPGLREDGSTYYLELISRPYNYRGRSARVAAVRDITERIRAEQAVRQSEERYRLLAENASDVIWTADMNLQLTYISPSVTRMRGYTVEEMMTQKIEEGLTRASIQVVMKVLAEELEIEKTEQKDLSRTRTLELEEYCKDGSTIWVEEKVAFLRDPDGRAVGIVGVTRDITQRKRAEEAVRESEGRYSLLAQNASDVIWTTDMNLRYTYVSPSVTRLRGYSVEEVMQEGLGESLIPASLLVGREALQHQLAIETSKEEDPQRSWTVELEMNCKDGSTVWTEVRMTFLRDPDGQAIGILGVSRDISERKRMEVALQKTREELESKAERQMRRGNAYGLTFRELTVLHLVAAGQSDREIGLTLGISHLTAQKHVANILGKMDATSRTEAGVRALREGLLE